jgi:hypothetical protein
MSAFIVSKRHIDYLVQAAHVYTEKVYLPGYKYDPARVISLDIPEDMDRLGQILWDENFKSVNYLYDEEGVAPEYHFAAGPGIEMYQVLNSLACYEYQACEHPEWEKSDAWYICQYLRKDVARETVERVKALRGIEFVWGAPWEGLYEE